MAVFKRFGWAGLWTALSLFFLFASSSFITQGCGNSATAPVTVTQIVVATPSSNSVAGKDWNYAILNAPFAGRGSGAALSYNNLMWLIGGAGSTALNDVWSSPDGSTWTQQLANSTSPGTNQFAQRYGLVGFTFNNALWVMAGQGGTYFNDTWTSTDGANWTRELASTASPGPNQFPTRVDASGVTFNNKMWIIGGFSGSGYLNDVWSSSDGVSWTRALADTASPGTNQFSRRYGQASVVFNNKMWVMGGYDGTNYLNDTWSSSDGVSWTKVDSNAISPIQFTGRNTQGLLVFNGVMWVIGGYDGSNYLHDVWYSADGKVWTQLQPSASFPGRSGPQALVFGGKMWVIGGNSFNDAWYSPF